ncbi:ATP-dependent helicase Lhr and Lhr-like helicase [Chitinophaga eiseniae]|uniref:ATP-dependent helicase Lhr and Lhr-like helicase n=1 Tax=Chitinophaga eiseniae TaxID=634771 RepID=A0A1T4T750_9BACT|nr:DEAD/DEAH box helicase [Chitinophaga eiseniae]SKA36314.1 ATP-dependent helicase Lhr and Lhr-like helicase [Chitinophaga eiseniae]
MAYELLSEPVRRYIRDKKWEALRPIQDAAIKAIMRSEGHYILASRTASGKTEAAFLPVLSSVDFREKGVQVLYISPLIALINDQFQRCEALCRYMDVLVTKWHGEANQSGKKRLLADPQGVMLITPESIEAMLVNHPGRAKSLFSNLKFIIIDEIHAFLGTDRGRHLQSLLSRICSLKTGAPVRIVGLSATIGDENFQVAKRFLDNTLPAKVLIDRTAKENHVSLKFSREDAEFSVGFIESLYELTKDKKVLIFPNARGRAEEIAVKLSKTAARRKGHAYYFSHHSSVDKDLREYVENFAKTNERHPFCICCTSTLELGIDIGTVDMVVQIDASNSVASLVQRMGRAGRREGATSELLLYGTHPWAMLQSLACWQLYEEGFMEPIVVTDKPYDLLFHQILSILKETNGISHAALTAQLTANHAFQQIPAATISQLLAFMIQAEYVEVLGRELIVGYEGEKLTNSRDFYSVFFTDRLLKVIHAGNTIGEIPDSVSLAEDVNIYLAAKIWKVKLKDIQAAKILVEPAHDGKKPIFGGEGPAVQPRVRARMLEIVYQDLPTGIMDEKAIAALEELRFELKQAVLTPGNMERPYVAKETGYQYYTFTGSVINRTLMVLLKLADIDSVFDDDKSMFSIADKTWEPAKLWPHLEAQLAVLCGLDLDNLEKLGLSCAFLKWGQYLPPSLQEELIRSALLDIPGTTAFLQQVRFVTC